jgi:ribonuclease J
MMNHFARRGAELVYGHSTPPIHVSGHGYRDELMTIINLIRPRYFMPVHGEYLQLIRHAQLAAHLEGDALESTFIIENGETLEIDERGARKGPKVASGRVCIDSGSLDDVVEDVIIRDRDTGKLQNGIEMVSRGFVSLEESSELLPLAKQVVQKTVENSSADERGDWGVMQEKIRADLRRFFNKQTQRRPVIVPVVMEV